MYSKVENLKDSNEAQNQLNFLLSYCKTEDFIFGLYNVAVAQGFVAVASRAGLSRENLYRTLQPHAKPSFDKLVKVLNAMGFMFEIRFSKRAKLISFVRQNSLEQQYPDVALEWNIEKNLNLIPNDVTPQSRKKVWWKCSRMHEWEELVISRTKGKKCPFCEAIDLMAKLSSI